MPDDRAAIDAGIESGNKAATAGERSLIVRREQLAALSSYARTRFERAAVRHLQECWPAQCEALGHDGVLQSVRSGALRAEAFGIRSEREVLRFLDLMYLLAQNFDSHPQLPWARELLERRDMPSWVRLERLWQRAKRELDVRLESTSRGQRGTV